MTNAAHEVTLDQTDAMADVKADELRTRVRELLTDINKDTFEAGGVLWKLSNQAEQLRRWGHRSIGEFAEAEGIGARKAEYLVRNYVWFKVKHPLPKELADRLQDLPWTKVRELVGIMTAENAAEWLAIAESVSRDELTRKTKAEKENPSTASTSDDGQAQQAPARSSFGEYLLSPIPLTMTLTHRHPSSTLR